MAPEIKVKVLVAMDQERVIGFQGKLPWNIPEDLKRFSSLTRGHTVFMGRKTFDSLPAKYKPLPDRKNIVVSKTLTGVPGMDSVIFRDSIAETIAEIKSGQLPLPSDTLWIIGGEKIYRATQFLWDEVYLTLVAGRHEGDAVFPEFEMEFNLVQREDFTGYSFLKYIRRM